MICPYFSGNHLNEALCAVFTTEKRGKKIGDSYLEAQAADESVYDLWKMNFKYFYGRCKYWFLSKAHFSYLTNVSVLPTCMRTNT